MNANESALVVAELGEAVSAAPSSTRSAGATCWARVATFPLPNKRPADLGAGRLGEM